MSSFLKTIRDLMRRAAPLTQPALIGLLCLAAIPFLLSIPLISDSLVDDLQTIPVVTQSELVSASTGAPCAIVVLSAGRRVYAPEFGDETLDEFSLERVRYGALLARETGLPVLVSGGAFGRKEIPIAQLMAETLSKEFGVQVRWLEVNSTTTAENAIFTGRILKQMHISRIILVTHAWHMKRARAAFVANGMTVIPAPTAFYRPERDNVLAILIPSAGSLRMAAYAIHEIVGSVWYSLKYGY